MTQEEIIEYLRDRKKLNLRQGIDWGCKKNGKHISVYWVDEEGLFQIAHHNIQGDVVLTDFEIWVDKETGVNYLFHASGYAGGLTVMLDKDGKPIVTPINE